MAIIHFTYKVNLRIDEKDLLQLTEFLEHVKKLEGDAKLLKTQTAKVGED